MIKYYKTDDQLIREEPKIEDGVWVQMVDPTAEECAMIADALNVDIGDVQAALDEEESSRIELEDGYTLILVDIPAIEIRHGKESYTTIPLGIILTRDVIVTVCTEDTPILRNFVISRVKEFSTKKKCVLYTRFCSALQPPTRAICGLSIRSAQRLRKGRKEHGRCGFD